MMERNSAHYNFVIADDDIDDQQLLLDAFRESCSNYTSMSVYNGRELLDYLLHRNSYADAHHEDPDFIFLDINMPEKNGFEVLVEIKAINELRNIPVYIFSTSCSLNDQKVMIALGAKRCYIKPSEFDEYKKMIYEIVSPVSN